MRASVGAALVCLALALFGCGAGSRASSEGQAKGPPAKPSGPLRTESPVQAVRRPEPKVTPPTGEPSRKLLTVDLIKGSGKVAKKRDDLAVHFTSIRINGEPFESIWDKPFEFELSQKDVNPGWVQGLPGMKAGGRRELIVPTKMTSRYPILKGWSNPENALVYVVDLLAVR